MAAASWPGTGPDGIRVRVKVTPRAATGTLSGTRTDTAGLRPAPAGGKASAELVRLLARRWRVPAQRITLVRGAPTRRKVLHLEGAPDRLPGWRRRIEEDALAGGGRT